MTLVRHTSTMTASADALFELHMDARNLPKISPPFPPARLLSEPKRSEVGDLQLIQFGSGPLSAVWHARVTQIVPGRMLEDRLERGLFRRWRHQHRVLDLGDGRAQLTDVVSFRLLPTPLGEFVEYWAVRPALKLMFVMRHRRTASLLRHGSS